MRIHKAITLFIVYAPEMGGKWHQREKVPVTPVEGYGKSYFKSVRGNYKMQLYELNMIGCGPYEFWKNFEIYYVKKFIGAPSNCNWVTIILLSN